MSKRLRKILVNSLAHELSLKKNEGLDISYSWFTSKVKEHGLTSSEQFSIVFLAGGLNNKEEPNEL